MYVLQARVYRLCRLMRERKKVHMGLTCKPVRKMRSITRKLENQLADEAKLQKEKKESKKDKTSR